ncbi:transglycosylase domain-containing protein [Bacillus alkalicellulosilyticus]|uniref:transglycosylase domain-containing protein n=1 Tax=Alkalihalobacterium alkalicellulosilyticum TaxID=1912214 RepID=UPI0009973593|nr:PBP1A family penicillin-binding protein [Bacillus alkalicellulosilyticus]
MIIIGTTIPVIGLFFSFSLYLFIILAGDYVIDDKKLVMNTATKIVNEDEEELTKLFVENRELTSIHEIPEHVQHAFVAIEDARFYDHQGVDIRAIARALYRDILAGSKVEGGSTITQQLAKNTFLTPEKTFLRKTNEVLIAMNLERRYSKEQLLEMYLNRIYFGHGAYGIQSAATLYFNKDVSELTVEDGALLAGLPKAPNSYSPINHPVRSKQRRDLVLSVMERRGYLSAEEAVRLQGKTVAINVNRLSQHEAYATYIDMVLDEAEERFHLTNEEVLTGGYTIVVPMDKQLQETSFKMFQDDGYFPGTDEHVQGAFVMLDVRTGAVLAAQGGRQYISKGINRVNVKRQPGSTFKPVAVYGPALEEGKAQPYSLLRDELLEYDGYAPRNANQQYQGEMTMYDAITHSTNASAVWLFNQLGIGTGKTYLDKLGLGVRDNGLAIALGGLEEGVSPLQLSKAYRAFAKEGKLIDHYVISEMYDGNGKLLGRASIEEQEVFSKQTAWNMTRMLESVVIEGTARHGESSKALAGKTGTTSYTDIEGAIRDAWFVGYTPEVVGAVWIGYDATTDHSHLTGGSSYATQLFKDILNQIPLQNSYSFTKPNDVNELEEPIRLGTVSDVSAKLTFAGRGLVGVRMNWTALEDKRIQYRIYELTKEGMNHIGTVVGEGSFTVGSVNPFSLKEYIVIPYNPQTEQEGTPSNTAEVLMRIGF